MNQPRNQYEPTADQQQAIDAYVQRTLLPLIGAVLTKQLGMAAVFLQQSITARQHLATGSEQKEDVRGAIMLLMLETAAAEIQQLRQQVATAEQSGYDRGCAESQAAVFAVLDGSDDDSGICHPRWQKLRQQLLDLKTAAKGG